MRYEMKLRRWTCADCGVIGEVMTMTRTPVRCETCRAERKKAQHAASRDRKEAA